MGWGQALRRPWTVPICEPAGQLGLAASAAPEGLLAVAASAASEHNGTPATLASMPGGSETESPESSWSVSEREKDSTNGE